MELDARAKAAEAIDRRARQRQAAAAAQQALTPEAIAAEEERQRALDPMSAREFGPEELAAAGFPQMQEAQTLSSRLADAVQPLIDGAGEPAPDVVGLGRAVVQWALTVGEEAPYELALQVQVDEQPPAGVVLEISDELLETWRKGEGLQGNRIIHKKFAAGIIEKTIELAAEETGNHLIFALEELLREPTRTAVGDED